MISSTSLGAFSTATPGKTRPGGAAGPASATQDGDGIQQVRSRTAVGSTRGTTTPSADTLSTAPSSTLPRGSLLNLSV